jgi:ABC-type glycerol-3-phosphate transport system permease component
MTTNTAPSRTSVRTKTSATRSRTGGRRRIGTATATYVVLIAGAVVLIVPLLWTISTSLKDQSQVFTYPVQWIPRPFKWSNYSSAFDTAPIGTYLVNTIMLTTIGVIGSLIGSSIAGYGFARFRFKGRQLMFGVMLATMMVPTWTVIIPMFLMFQRIGWLDTYLPLVVPAFFATPFNTFLIRQFFLTVPYEIDEAARADGATRWQVFTRIMIPIARPALLIVAIYSFFYYWNEFLLPLLYLQTDKFFPVSVGVANFASAQQQNYPLMMAIATVALAPPMIVFFVFQRWFIQGVVVTGIKA